MGIIRPYRYTLNRQKQFFYTLNPQKNSFFTPRTPAKNNFFQPVHIDAEPTETDEVNNGGTYSHDETVYGN